jgi:ABC-type multidrug transport system fused ATPase/permease subunit
MTPPLVVLVIFIL